MKSICNDSIPNTMHFGHERPPLSCNNELFVSLFSLIMAEFSYVG